MKLFKMFKGSEIITKTEFEELFEEILQRDFLAFGSRAWGGATEKSDYDYMGTHEALKSLRLLLDKYQLKYSMQKDDAYTRLLLSIDAMLTVVIDGKKYQFCIPKEKDQNYFDQSIRLMTAYAATTDLSAKNKRIETFEAINQLIKKPQVAQRYKVYRFIDDNFPEYLI